MDPIQYRLWDGEAPGQLPEGEIPMLTYYPAAEKRGNGTVVIFPGGAYVGRAPHEGRDYALYLNAIGLDAFVCDYRVAPNRFPYELADARRAVRFVRANAEKFGIDKTKVAVMGSSAGGHLAALVSTYRGAIDGENTDEIDREDACPNATILCYPVINATDDAVRHAGSIINLLGADHSPMEAQVSPELIADEHTPPAFLWHTAADGAVPVENSIRYVQKLHSMDIPVELHIFPFGSHGMGLAGGVTEGRPIGVSENVAQWAGLLRNWLALNGFLA